MRDTQLFQERIGKIEKLVHKLEGVSDPALRRIAKDLLESVMELHGAGFDRLLEIVSTNTGETGAVILQEIAGDPLLSSLLVLYGLHPDNFETRVRRGLDNARKELRLEGARVELVAVSDGAIRVKIISAGTNNFEPAVRAALLETAPDALNIEIQGGIAAKPSPGFVPLSSLLNGSSVAIGDRS